MTHKVHMEYRQKNVKVKDALSKLLLHLLKANIAKQKAEWDSLEDYNEVQFTFKGCIHRGCN
jgi:hypothetical protein